MNNAAATGRLRFTKMQGAGNDFVILDLRDGRPAPDEALARALADRHFGVGCDQLITIERPRNGHAVASYRIWNADGSRAQQCGNGARCVAAWLVRDGAVNAPRFVLDSDAGEIHVDTLEDGVYALDMGLPAFEPTRIPLLARERLDLYALPIDGEPVVFSALSMGNPHAVIEVDSVAAAPVHTLGPALQRQLEFPQGVNVGFAEIIAPDRIALRVYERGAGETLACGSGACAAAVALIRRGRVQRRVCVMLPGGELEISWPADDAPVRMAGPATFVFEGEWIP